MPQGFPTEEFLRLVLGDLGHEAAEVANPGVVAVPLEQNIVDRELLLADVQPASSQCRGCLQYPPGIGFDPAVAS